MSDDIESVEAFRARARAWIKANLGPVQGWDLSQGAVVLAEGRVLHGAEAIQWICSRLEPSATLLQLLGPILATPGRAKRLYPALLLARRLALAVQGLPLDPDQPAGQAATGSVN